MAHALWRTLFRPASRSPSDDEATHDSPSSADRAGIQTSAAPSVTARIQRVLGLGLFTALALGFLTYYYAHAFARTRSAAVNSRPAATPADTGAALPPLVLPHPAPIPTPASTTPAPTVDSPYLIGNVLTDTPGNAEGNPDLTAIERATAPSADAAYGAAPTSTPAATPRPSPLERRLSGAVFARAASGAATTPAPVPTDSNALPAELAAYANASAPTIGNATGATPDPPDPLTTLLKPHVTSAVTAALLPTQRLLLPKGSFIDCTLETAIDSTLPGLTTCLTAADTYSADGTVILLERGTKLIGETRGAVEQGASRLFVLWTEARTPNGVVVTLDSPGTDELGRSGLAGQVNRHFPDRFGAAILISMIDGAIQAATQSRNASGASVTYNAAGSRDVLTEVLKSTINIPPTVTKHQGDRIQILVARDLDFRSVYALHTR